MSRFMSETWFRLFEMGQSDDETEKMYSEVLRTLISIRLEKDMTQIDVARKSGLTTSMISKIESQNVVPSMMNFFKYLRGLDMDWLLKPRER